MNELSVAEVHADVRYLAVETEEQQVTLSNLPLVDILAG